MVFFVIELDDGRIRQASGWELLKDAEDEALSIASDNGIVVDTYEEIEEAALEQRHGIEVVIEHGPYFSKEEGSTYAGYDYEYFGKYVTADELLPLIREKGFVVPENAIDLRDWLKDDMTDQDTGCMRQSVEGLKIKYEMTYRGGEIEETVFADDPSDAFDMVCEWNHHYDMWEISDE